MLVQSNLNRLADESLRHLVADVYPGDISNPGNDWQSTDGFVPAPADQINERIIAWSRKTARCYGPFVELRDRIDATTGAHSARKVKAYVRCYGDGTTAHRVYVAATGAPRPPSDGYLDLQRVNGTTPLAASATNYAVTLTWTRDAALQTHRVGPPTDPGAGQINEPEFWLWCGFHHFGSGTLGIVSVTAFETFA